ALAAPALGPVAQAASGITAPAGSVAPGPRSASDTLIIARDQSDALTMDPHRMFEFTAGFMCFNIYDQLVTNKSPDDVNTFVPMPARSWTISPDGKMYTFQLRDDVKFASGNPFTAEDVKFSLMRLKNLKGNPGWMADHLVEIQVLDPYTVMMMLDDSVADWLA